MAMVSMPLANRSPTRCLRLPFGWAGDELTSFKRLMRFLLFSSRNIIKLPQLVLSAGMAFFFIHAPLAYSKKSSPGFTDISMLAGSIYFLSGGGGVVLPLS